MIGLHAQNKNTELQILNLLKDFDIEIYDTHKSYDSLIWLSDTKPPKDSTLLISQNDLPLSFFQWHTLLQKGQANPVSYSNDFFSFDSISRTVKNLKTKELILLTEKETAFLVFLVQANNHSASKEQILHEVWQYNPEAETHTLESHFYALKQKLGRYADNLICFQDGFFFLV